MRSRAEREWTKRALVGGAFSAQRVIPYSKVVDGRGRQNERAWRILRQPARRVALWRAKYDSDKIRPDLNRVTVLDGPLLARSGRWDVRLRFRWLSLAEPSSNFPMMDWNEKLVFSNSW